LLAASTPEQLRDTVPAVHRIFVDARAQVMEETLGNLSGFYAMFPGNHKFNVFPLWLSEDHHARLSSVFAPSIGHPRSEDLDSEYLNIFETRTRTPFFQDVYVDGVRVMLIIGPTGSGKSVHGNAAIALEQKYNGFRRLRPPTSGGSRTRITTAQTSMLPPIRSALAAVVEPRIASRPFAISI
jgi:type IV secretion system protein VirB4